MNLTLINQVDISPPGSLHNLHENFPDKISSDFYTLCKDGGDIIDSNIEWLKVIPNWFEMVPDDYEISYSWAVSFTLVIKLKEGSVEDSLLLIRLKLDDGWYHFHDIKYEEISEDDLVNFTQKV